MRLLRWLAFFAFALAAAARAEDAETVATVRAHARAATGAMPAASQIVVTYVAYGSRGRRTTFRVGDDFRQIVEDGPFVTQRGVRQKQAWHQNENGETVLDQPDPGAAKPDIVTTTLTPIATPIVGYLVAALDSAGHGTREYVESATWRVVRVENVAASATTTTIYDDFRTTEGTTRAWHWTVRDGHPENDAEYRIASVTRVATVADVEIPSARRNLVAFPDGVTSVALPVRERGDKFYVRVDIGGRGLDFLLDTGAAGLAIDENVARELGLTVYGQYSSGFNAGRYVSSRVLVPRMTIGALTMTDVAMATTPHVGLRAYEGDVRPVGLLGFDFIGALALELDYERGTVTARDPVTFAPPTAPHTIALDVRLWAQQPLTDVAINGALGERFGIDTGASGTMLVFDYFQRRHPEALVDRGGGGILRERRFLGVGGAIETKPYDLASVRVGNANFRDVLAYAVHSRVAYGVDEDGMIGTDFLRLFTVSLDYANSRIYLTPNDAGFAAKGR